jgi:hypothetical protein
VMDLSTSESGRAIKPTERGSCTMLMVMYTKESGGTTRRTGREPTLIRTRRNTWATGLTTVRKGKESKCGLMGLAMKVERRDLWILN